VLNRFSYFENLGTEATLVYGAVNCVILGSGAPIINVDNSQF